MAKHICLFSGPSAGKSTASAGLFALMKRKNYKVELVTEYAKELVYSKDFMTLSDQLMVLAKQHHNWFKLEEQVDFTVSDAPFLLSAIYSQPKQRFPLEQFNKYVIDTYKMYDTVNFFIERNNDHYQDYGRNEELEESIEIDNKIKKLLKENDIPFKTIKADNKTIKKLYKEVKKLSLS